MHITFLTYGSQGDVEPFVALGKGLRRAGYDVRLAAPEVFSRLVTSYGLNLFGPRGNPEHLIRNLQVSEARSVQESKETSEGSGGLST